MIKLLLTIFTLVFIIIALRSFFKVITGKGGSRKDNEEVSLKEISTQETFDDTDMDDAIKNTLGDLGSGVAKGFSNVGEVLGDATLDIKKILDESDNNKVAGSVGRTIGTATYDIGKTLGKTAIGTSVKAGKRLFSFMEKNSK